MRHKQIIFAAETTKHSIHYTMKKAIITMAILLLAVAGLAQAQTHEFAPVGAEWFYERYYREGWNFTGVAYDRFRSIREVEINGWECKEIELFQNLDCHGDVNPYTEIRYITQEGDRVYEVENGQRFLLYDFGKEVGEWWYAPKYEDTIRVVNVSYITMNDGNVRRFMEILPSNFDWYFFYIIDGIGMEESLFPFDVALMGAPCVKGPLRCYSEDGIPLIEWGETECDYEVMAIDENGEMPTASMNTLVDDMLHIDFLKMPESIKQIKIVDLTGRIVCTHETMDKAIDIGFADKPRGVYVVQTITASQVINNKVVKR